MNVGNSVRKAIDDWTQGELESAMLHACNAVDGTAKKLFPAEKSNKVRFTRLLRDSYGILGPMAMPGIDLTSPLRVKIPAPTAPGGKPDVADVIYAVHR